MMTILGVTSSADIESWLVDSLAGRAGWHVICVSGWREALARLELHPVDVLVAGPEMSLPPESERADLPSLAHRCGIVTLGRGEPDSRACIHYPSPAANLREVILGAMHRRPVGQSLEALENPYEFSISLELELPNDQLQACKASRLLVQQAERLGWFEGRSAMQSGIALEEALLNAMIHGNLEVCSELRECEDDQFSKLIAQRQHDPAYRERLVHVLMEADETRARWVIRDDGPGFDVKHLPDPRSPERLTLASGRGVLLMRTFMDRVTYNARGNQVEMVKYNSRAESLARIGKFAFSMIQASMI